MKTTRFQVGNFLKYKGKLCIVTDSCNCTIRVRINDKIDGGIIIQEDDYLEEIPLSKDILDCTNRISSVLDTRKEVCCLTSDLYLVLPPKDKDYRLAHWGIDNDFWDGGDYNLHSNKIKSLNQLQNVMSSLEEDFKVDFDKLKSVVEVDWDLIKLLMNTKNMGTKIVIIPLDIEKLF